MLDSVTLSEDCYNIQLPKELFISTSNRSGDEIISDFMQGGAVKIGGYPNPSRHSVTLNLHYGTCKLRFYGRLGKKVLEASYQNTRQVEVDIHAIPNGIYKIDVESAFRHAEVSLIKN